MSFLNKDQDQRTGEWWCAPKNRHLASRAVQQATEQGLVVEWLSLEVANSPSLTEE